MISTKTNDCRSAWAFAALGFVLSASLDAAERPKPDLAGPADQAVAAYDGHFVAGPFEFQISHDGDQLSVSFDRQAPAKLVAVGPDEFRYLRGPGSLKFLRGPGGQVDYLLQQFGGVPIEAPRQGDQSQPPVPVPRAVPDQAYRYHAPIEPSYRDLAYAPAFPAEKLDLYLPAPGHGPSPVVIWMHGGGFMVGDKRSMPRRNFDPAPPAIGPMGPFQIQVPDAAALTEKGYAVVSLNYRLLMGPGVMFRTVATAAVQDAKAAVRFLRANAGVYNLDPDKFAVWGNSAGGYMAAMLGVTGDQASRFDAPELGNPSVSSAVQAVVVWYGAVDDEGLLPAVRFPHYLATAKVVPPFLIANGDDDRNVPVANARKFDQLLRGHGNESILVILPGASHEDPAFMATQMEPTFRFLDHAFGLGK